MVIERIVDAIQPYSDVGGRVIGLCLLKATKLLYLDLRILLNIIIDFCKIGIEGGKALGRGLGEHKDLRGLFLGIWLI